MRFSFSFAAALAAAATSLAGAASPQGDSADFGASLKSHDSIGVSSSQDDSSILEARSPRRGRFQGFAQNFRQIQDPNLAPGNAFGQGQNSGPQGVGQESVNGTSGLPNGIIDFNDPQKNLFLDPSQIATGLASDGTAGGAFTPSLTSTNNFINFCLTRNDLPLTNGNQVKTGSCNAVPMGIIAAQTVMPSSKFVNPKNLDTIAPDTTFTIQMAISNLQTGNFVNAQANYYSAPQQTNAQGQIIGHSHVVIEQIDSLTTTTVSDPTKFAFFKGLNDPAANGILSATVTGGLPAGVYKHLGTDRTSPGDSINAASNHQPALVGVAQHGSLDDAVYFTVSANGNANAAGTAASAVASASTGGGGNGSAAAASSAAASSAASAAQTGQAQAAGRSRQAFARSLPDAYSLRAISRERRLEKTLAALVEAERA
ncbi:hypothetical protein BMF94_4872 [Rhodotorula taiwanensis]|uniref:Uncharacterized protein n=1 Tax=Rhodotorula taiwanensis TaxID=741276 RepID=A0A2S5B5T5_9BASI|nr:hypothetical protein BMF94_4872 [Rhodotorula taiwanensis]